MANLVGKIAVVTGASRGVGRGIALGLGEAGATVYVTGRSIAEGQGREGLPGTVFQTASDVTAQGGIGIAVRCDHRHDAEVESLFQRVLTEQGRLDILVNNVWDGYQRMVENGQFTWVNPFWQQPLWRAADPNIMEKSGKVLVAASLGLEYGFTDIDGKQPRPLTLEEA